MPNSFSEEKICKKNKCVKKTYRNRFFLHTEFHLQFSINKFIFCLFQMSNQNEQTFSSEVDNTDFTNFSNVDSSTQSYAPINNQQHQNWATQLKIKQWAHGNIQNNPQVQQQTPTRPQWAQNFGAQGFTNPRAQNPRAQNPRAQNPRAQNPRAQIPGAQNPRAQNPKNNNNFKNSPKFQGNQGPKNPRFQNPNNKNKTNNKNKPISNIPPIQIKQFPHKINVNNNTNNMNKFQNNNQVQNENVQNKNNNINNYQTQNSQNNNNNAQYVKSPHRNISSGTDNNKLVKKGAFNNPNAIPRFKQPFRAGPTMDCNIYVGKVPANATNYDLDLIFQRFGNVFGSHVWKDERYPDKNLGFGLVSFSDEVTAATAVKHFSGPAESNEYNIYSVGREFVCFEKHYFRDKIRLFFRIFQYLRPRCTANF